jgi:DNA-binding NarL/FixJ family response regulator
MITSDPSRELEVEARAAGVKGYAQKTSCPVCLKAVEIVIGGGTYFGEDAAA